MSHKTLRERAARLRAHASAVALSAAVLGPALAHAQPKTAPATATTAMPAASQAPAAASPADEATSLFKKAIAAHDAGKLAEAEALFLKAWALKKTWDIAANLGLVESRLGKHAAAAEHLAHALSLVPPTEPRDTTAQLVKQLDAARAEVVAITVTANVDGAEVRAGGELKGTTPLDGPLYVMPGKVTIELTKDGYESTAHTIEGKKGSEERRTFVLVARPAPTPSRAPALIAFGVGGAGLILGAVAGGLAVAGSDSLAGECNPSGGCPPAQRGALETTRALSHASTAGFVIAGVGAAVGVTLLLLPSKSAPAQTSLRVGPGFVGVKGAF